MVLSWHIGFLHHQFRAFHYITYGTSGGTKCLMCASIENVSGDMFLIIKAFWGIPGEIYY